MSDRPEHAPGLDHPLMLAARYLNAEAEDHDLTTVVAKRGLDLPDVEYLAEQRALRLVLVQSGRKDEAKTAAPTEVLLTEAQQRLIDALVPLYVDALLIGWRGREIYDPAPGEDEA